MPFRNKLRGHLSALVADSDESSDDLGDVFAYTAAGGTDPVLRRGAVPASRGTVPVTPRAKSELKFASPVAVKVAFPALNRGKGGCFQPPMYCTSAQE